MALTPVEIRHIKLSRSLFGYERGVIDELLEDIVESFEQVWRERADLADKIERVEEDLVRYRELETLLRTTLVSAERASQDLKEQARRETRVMLDEAHAEARRIRREAAADLERMRTEARRIRSLLGAALATIDEDDGAEEGEAKAASG
jgi:cell division initiation protein